MSKPPSTGTGTSPSSAERMQRAAVGEIIRQAEKQIGAQQYQRARDLLGEAWRLEPGNPYIPAIVERVELLAGRTQETFAQQQGAPHALSLSVGREFPGGIRPAMAPALPEEVRTRIRRLLIVIASLYDRGAYESAYETLLKAEDLDPLNAEVIAAKNKILPAYQVALKRREADLQRMRRNDLPGAAATMAERLLSENNSAGATDSGVLSFNRRLEELRRQKEEERQVRERAAWRQGTGAGEPSTPLAAPGTQGEHQKDPSTELLPKKPPRE
jgi:tetratricopeptide (TPR) repeat protein